MRDVKEVTFHRIAPPLSWVLPDRELGPNAPLKATHAPQFTALKAAVPIRGEAHAIVNTPIRTLDAAAMHVF